MAFVLPEIGIAGVESIEGLEDARVAESTVPKMEKPAVLKIIITQRFIFI